MRSQEGDHCVKQIFRLGVNTYYVRSYEFHVESRDLQSLITFTTSNNLRVVRHCALHLALKTVVVKGCGENKLWPGTERKSSFGLEVDSSLPRRVYFVEFQQC